MNVDYYLGNLHYFGLSQYSKNNLKGDFVSNDKSENQKDSINTRETNIIARQNRVYWNMKVGMKTENPNRIWGKGSPNHYIRQVTTLLQVLTIYQSNCSC